MIAAAVLATSAIAPWVAESGISREATIGLVCLAAGLVLGPVAVAAALRARPGRNVFFARWGFSQALVAIVGAAVTGWLLAVFVPAGADYEVPIAGGLAVGVALAARAAQRLHPEGLRSLGFPGVPSARDFAVAVAVPALFAPALLGAALAWPTLLEPSERSWPALAELARGGDPLALVLHLLALPLLVELFFRSFLLPLFAQNFSEKGGVLVVAVLGAGLAGGAGFGAQVVLGIALGIVRLRCQHTLPCFAAHALYNAAALAIGPGLVKDGAPQWVPF